MLLSAPPCNSRKTGRPATRLLGLALLVPAVVALAGCASGPVETFDLTAVGSARANRAPHGQIVVSVPVATAPADGDRIVVRPSPESVATLKGAQWSERLPLLVQTRLVQSFENARLLSFVGRADSRITAPHSLTTEIRRFEIDVSRGEAVVEISVKLVGEQSGHIVAAQVFAASVPGSASDGQSAASALDAALSSVMSQIVVWAAART